MVVVGGGGGSRWGTSKQLAIICRSVGKLFRGEGLRAL